MEESKYKILKDFEIILKNNIESKESFERIMQRVEFMLHDYDVVPKSYELTCYTDENLRILKRYKSCLMVEGKSEKTIEAYEYRIRHLIRTTNMRLRDVGPYDIRYYLAMLKNTGCCNRTLDVVRCYISSFYKWAVLEGIIDKSPCDPIKPIKYTEEIKESFSDVDIEKLRSGCKNLKERAIVELLLSSGVRVSELVNMNIDDIDFRNNIVHVRHGKGDKERITYMSPVASYYVLKYIESREDNYVELFRSRKGKLSDGGVRYLLKSIGDEVGVYNVHPHRFRRTFATTLNNKGMPIQSIQHLMGHTKMDTTMIYVNVSDQIVHAEYQKCWAA